MESFLDKGYEVLFLTDPVDEVWLQMVPEFEELKMVNVSRGEVSLSDDQEKEKEELDAKAETFGSLLEKLKETLDEDIKEVRLSSRLTKISGLFGRGPKRYFATDGATDASNGTGCP